ncbi:hypothetical protein [Hyalangium versicolor]|uniref:hypothetical protein n=1 Tax=Hyalangium versicolor TaxID=2861190 RepID=UPI001CC8F5A2|nr:hypothetical protein [Hyalangium versicolor]
MPSNLPNRSKRLSSTLALSLALGTLAAGAGDTPKSVMDYYQQLPATAFPDSTRYELTRSKSGWITHSKAGDDEISVTVDTKNGYIEFTDEGTGGGDAKTQVALFLKEDKTPIMAVSMSSFDGVSVSGGITFAELAGNQWKTVTDHVLPFEMQIEDFLDEKCLEALNPAMRTNLINEGVIYTLPRQGTTIRASVKVTEYMLKDELQGKKSPCPSENPREMKWDKKAGRFSFVAVKPAGKK